MCTKDESISNSTRSTELTQNSADGKAGNNRSVRRSTFVRDGFSYPVTLRPRYSAAPLVLSAYTTADRQQWQEVRARNASWLKPWDSTSPVPLRSLTFRQWVSCLKKRARAGTDITWALRYNGQLIGDISVDAICYGALRMGIAGYWISQDYAGRSLTPLALARVCDWAFFDPNGPHLHRMEVDLLPSNERSRRVVEKVGFSYEGIRRGLMNVDHAWEDHECWSLLNNDQAALPGSVEWSFVHRQSRLDPSVS